MAPGCVLLLLLGIQLIFLSGVFFGHAALNKDRFAPVRNVCMPSFGRSTEFEYNVKYMDSILEMFEEEKPTLWSNEDLHEPLCFDQLNMAGRTMVAGSGGLWVSVEESERFRQKVMQLHNAGPTMNGVDVFNVTVRNGVPEKKRVFVVARENRSIQNREELLDHLRTHVRNIEVQVGYFHRMCFADQIKRMADADIVFGAHGSGLHNAHFLAPGSAVIEVNQHHWWHDHFGTEAEASGKAHYMVQCVKPPGFEQAMAGCAGQTAFHAVFGACRHQVMHLPLTVDIEWFELVFRKAITFVSQRKFPGHPHLRMDWPRGLKH